jgi:hypothetical protein
MTSCRRAVRATVRWISWAVPMVSHLISAGCAEVASPHPTAAAARTAAVDCGRIVGDGRTFYESNPTYADPVDDDVAWSQAPPERRGWIPPG